MWTDTVGQSQYGGAKVYVVQTGLKVVERCVLLSSDPGDLVVDPTCGSGTTAYVAEQWGVAGSLLTHPGLHSPWRELESWEQDISTTSLRIAGRPTEGGRGEPGRATDGTCQR